VTEETFVASTSDRPVLAAIFTPDQPPERLGAVASAADAAGLAQLWI
jgi:hypothetical protein